MIVVADTSPLNYLILIDEIDILPALFGQVVIPQSVYDELLDVGASATVRQWIDQLPSWLEVRTPSTLLKVRGLDRGESDAIVLFDDIGAERLIMDDRRGRREAQKRGIQTIGTLGLLQFAATAGLLDFELAIQRLQQTSFYVTPSFIARLLKK